ncbi:SurA N-terminal domain-containing protein [Actinopolymorpha alba]|uniref:SurA N-terminal domain-containing protein n=1 Tax=Actinopolymorpha alba TaxID=533267 RepID=UPI0003736A3F|nr:SurA N-terminal domain-containing protein [Actinopolymorpha alba]
MVGQRHTRRLAGVALVAALGLSGCGAAAAAKPGAAAQVGGEAISVSYVQKQLDELLAQAGRTNLGQTELADTQRALLQQLIEDSLIVATGERLGVTANQSAVDKVKDEIKAQQVMIPADMLDGFARWVALRRDLATKLLGVAPTTQDEQVKADELIAQELAKTAKAVGVTVNPRYGEWSGAQLRPGGQLVTTEPTAPATGLPEAPAPAGP